MSIQDQAAVLSQIAMAADGALVGLALAYVAVRSILKFKANSSSLHKIENAPSLSVSDLRSLLSSDTSSQSDGGKVVIVRGIVEAKSAVEGNWKSLRANVVSAHNSDEKGVILQRTQTCIYNEWRGFFWWPGDLHSIFPRFRKDQESSSLRMVPFVLVEAGRWPQPEYVNVNMDGSTHPLPLVTVYHHLQPVNATPLTFLQALFGHHYPVGVLDEEKILPLGKDVTSVGVCSSKDGIFEIKSCKDLPYFLSDMTKDQMLVDLAFKTRVLLWSGVVLGAVAVGVLGYAVVRNWNRWKQWRHQRQAQQQRDSASNDADSQVSADEETEDVPDGQLCVICLMRRRRSAFVPCGHLVCCQRCALSVERDLAPKCPLCRQVIRSSVRIYDS
ncbi:E3 ubiquitin-protein ligase SPL2 isoform X1 [Lycium ferocissimum]|uniref:E3 ubiquitin-protein ligase SPL2 isoform X1 n=1 Tax=Lycium ferocissimum TaxID=112874 RepID=UPI002816252B|nr:E3 ubiquitin-protein ligase SPL2 isoform X1 [Lycium ferocissimum]